MTLKQLQATIKTPVFSTNQVQKFFANEKHSHINISLSRMSKRGDLLRLKKGLFRFPAREVDELLVANLMYQPSYVSLESALHIYGMIPEEVMQVTSITTTKPKKFSTADGGFLYSKVKQSLFFGFEKIQDSYNLSMFYSIAEPEKALLDYIYIRQVKDLEEARVDLDGVNLRILRKFSKEFPSWVQQVVKEEVLSI